MLALDDFAKRLLAMAIEIFIRKKEVVKGVLECILSHSKKSTEADNVFLFKSQRITESQNHIVAVVYRLGVFVLLFQKSNSELHITTLKLLN